MIDIKGKYALVTGSSRGVGQQIALGLARLGCHLIIHGRELSHLKTTESLLKDLNVEVYAVEGDLSQQAAVAGLIEQVEQLKKPVDILYNNAGIMTAYRHDIWSHTAEDWLTSYQVNVVAMYALCSAFIPKMLDRGFGRVVNVTSGIMDQPQLAPYGASKWAVNKLSQDLAVALENTPVRLNYLDPTWLQTDLGGEHADHPVTAVLPGALDPALVDDNGPNGQLFTAL